MSELREKVLAIIAAYANCDPAKLADAKLIKDLPLDSIALLGAFDEIEEVLEIKIGEGVTPDTTIDEFEARLAALVAAKNA